MNKYDDAEPGNIDALCDAAEDLTSWRRRMEAVEQLGKWRCKKSIHALYRRIAHDKVFPVKESAFRKLQSFGEDVTLTRKRKGALVPKIDDKLKRVSARLSGQADLNEFKARFKEMYPEAYDLYEFDRGPKFDEWLLKRMQQGSQP